MIWCLRGTTDLVRDFFHQFLRSCGATSGWRFEAELWSRTFTVFVVFLLRVPSFSALLSLRAEGFGNPPQGLPVPLGGPVWTISGQVKSRSNPPGEERRHLLSCNHIQCGRLAFKLAGDYQNLTYQIKAQCCIYSWVSEAPEITGSIIKRNHGGLPR